MSKDLHISKISYLMDFGSTEEEHSAALSNLHNLKTRSTIESSYNSVVLVNAHDNDFKNQYNYLMYIDENGLGFPINTLITSEVSMKADNEINLNNVTTEPRIKITGLDITELATNLRHDAQIEQAEINHDLLNAVADIVNVFNDPGISTALGISSGSNSNAAQHVTNATSSIASAAERYNKAYAMAVGKTADDITTVIHGDVAGH